MSARWQMSETPTWTVHYSLYQLDPAAEHIENVRWLIDAKYLCWYDYRDNDRPDMTTFARLCTHFLLSVPTQTLMNTLYMPEAPLEIAFRYAQSIPCGHQVLMLTSTSPLFIAI